MKIEIYECEDWGQVNDTCLTYCKEFKIWLDSWFDSENGVFGDDVYFQKCVDYIESSDSIQIMKPEGLNNRRGSHYIDDDDCILVLIRNEMTERIIEAIKSGFLSAIDCQIYDNEKVSGLNEFVLEEIDLEEIDFPHHFEDVEKLTEQFKIDLESFVKSYRTKEK